MAKVELEGHLEWADYNSYDETPHPTLNGLWFDEFLSKLEKIKITQKELGKLTGTTDVTVRNQYKEIKKILSMNKKKSPQKQVVLKCI